MRFGVQATPSRFYCSASPRITRSSHTLTLFQDSASRYTSFRGAEFRVEVLRDIKSVARYV
jgi:hypothetical protein